MFRTLRRFSMIQIHSDAVQRVERPLFELRTTRRQQSAGIQISPSFQRRADGHAEAELGRHTKTDLRSVLTSFGVEHGKSPGQS